MKVSKLIKTLNTHIKDLPGDFQFRGISCNSKEVLKDFLFVAIKGSREDGNKYIEEAVSRGAKAIVVGSLESGARSFRGVPFIKVKDTRKALARLASEFYGNPSLRLKVVGVTGTNGKTTVTYLIERLLKEAGFVSGVIGTVNYRYKDKIIPSKNTTPGPVQLQSMLSDMVKAGLDYAVMEVSSHALDQARTDGIDFHSAIFTNLTQDHLDYHKTKQDYFQAKARLFRNLRPNVFAVINNDDRFGRMLEKLTKADMITYGLKNKSCVFAENIKFGCERTEFVVAFPGAKINITSRLIGRYNVYNILAAVAWGYQEGIKPAIIKRAMEKFRQVPGRLERVDSGSGFSVFVDYAHTEDALKNILQALRKLTEKRIIVVFGCGGERDKTKRPKMGRVVSELSDYAIITSDNPRSEDPARIIADIKRGIKKKNYCIVAERKEAIRKSLSLAGPEDIVLVAGKGHENYQILKDTVIHFDDREVVKECLRSMN